MSQVSLVKTEDCVDGFQKSIDEAINLINYSLDKELEHIIIKPNLCYYWDYSTGNTTDPNFVCAIIKYLQEKTFADIKISIVESDASAMKTEHAFRFLGYEKLLKHGNITLTNLSQEEYEIKKIKIGDDLIEIRVPEIITNSDLRINVPKIKYMGSGVKITCALKNIFGCIPQPRKYRFHKNLANTIVAANKAMKFDLNIVDSNIAAGARPKKIGLVMASNDLVANDVVAAKIASINPNSIKYLGIAYKEGLGEYNYQIKGESLDYFKDKYPHKTLEDEFWSMGYKIYQRLYE